MMGLSRPGDYGYCNVRSGLARVGQDAGRGRVEVMSCISWPCSGSVQPRCWYWLAWRPWRRRSRP